MLELRFSDEQSQTEFLDGRAHIDPGRRGSMTARRVFWPVALAVVFLSSISRGAIDPEFLEDQPKTWIGTSCERTEKDFGDGRKQGANVGRLQEVLRQHKLWLETKEKHGQRAKLAIQDLEGADLSQAKLSRADISNASLPAADLSSATLDEANLSESDFSRANLDGANLSKADLHGADLSCASLTGADLTGANLGCIWDNSERCADLSQADFRNAKLANAKFDFSDVSGAIFEPDTNPNARDIAAASGLELLTYVDRPDSLYQLRKQFQDGGFAPQEKQITYALNHRQAELSGPYARWFNTIAFDWTTQYGMNPGRSLKIWLTVFLACWTIYFIFIRFAPQPGIYLADEKEGKTKARRENILPLPVAYAPHWSYPFRIVGREMRLVYWAGFFSLTSAFNIGFHDVDFGRWLKLLTRTEYDIRAEGWTRTIAGFQSLVSMYLMALWLLTYFGRPFQ